MTVCGVLVMASLLFSPRRLLLPLSVSVVLTVISPGAGDVFTSTQNIVDMVASESTLLEGLNKHIVATYDDLKALSQFLFERTKTFHQPRENSSWQLAEHPNGAYLLIQFFSKHWTPLVNARPGLRNMIGLAESTLPTDDDFEGALSSLVRLQHVYQFSVTDMYAGNYLGYGGPALRPPDTYLLGRRAFSDGFLPECIQWLQLAVRLLEEQGGHFPATTNVMGIEVSPPVSLAQAAALLGRASVYMEDREKAQEMYDLSSSLNPQAGDVSQLKKELEGHQVVYKRSDQPWDHNMTTLCLRPKHRPLVKMLPLHVCRYKQALGLSYLRYKEEILSIQPYVSLFHDVIRDNETDAIKRFVKGKMKRGLVGEGASGKTDKVRTSDLGWIHDKELSTVASLSQKVKLITGLEVDQRDPGGPSSSEALQVVNYGLGGLYDAHVDPFKTEGNSNPMLAGSGFRIATFLMYLSEVELGGSTVFVKANISVAPRKGMALFWYNFGPDMVTIDDLTQHAGCPVVIGQKWVANKWIWTYGNTFNRPCGPHVNSTQLHVEQLVAKPPSL